MSNGSSRTVFIYKIRIWPGSEHVRPREGALASHSVWRMDLTELTLEIIDDLSLSVVEREQLRQLLAACFSEYGQTLDRTYFKQIPQRRLIARKDGNPVGHIGLEHRVVGVDGKPLEILGLIDVCVHPSCRGRGVATQMLGRIEKLARQNGVPFLMLFATDDRLYATNGFSCRRNRLTWLKIHEHRSLGSGGGA